MHRRQTENQNQILTRHQSPAAIFAGIPIKRLTTTFGRLSQPEVSYHPDGEAGLARSASKYLRSLRRDLSKKSPARGGPHMTPRHRILFVRMTTMKCCPSVPVFVLALLITQLTTLAQTTDSPPSNPQPPALPGYAPVPNANSAATQPGTQNNSLVPSKNSLKKFSPIRTGDAAMPEDSYNGFAEIRNQPDLGAPGSAGSGFHHFSMPLDKYTQWYRPRAATLTKYQRCTPDLFRPRGFGNLFNRPCDGYRMDFEPYVLGDGPSKYGPSYIARMPDQRCRNCDCCMDRCECE